MGPESDPFVTLCSDFLMTTHDWNLLPSRELKPWMDSTESCFFMIRDEDRCGCEDLFPTKVAQRGSRKHTFGSACLLVMIPPDLGEKKSQLASTKKCQSTACYADRCAVENRRPRRRGQLHLWVEWNLRLHSGRKKHQFCIISIEHNPKFRANLSETQLPGSSWPDTESARTSTHRHRLQFTSLSNQHTTFLHLPDPQKGHTHLAMGESKQPSCLPNLHPRS